jgi:predicted GH43/DUF377 family glycosyl hydrolase
MKTKSNIKLILTGLIVFTFMSINSPAQDTPWWNSWVKYPTNQPVIVGDNDSWAAYLSCPTVIFDDGIFKMWFRGIDYENTTQQIGYAWSYDGINWEVKEVPVIPAITVVNECIIKGTGTVLRINDTLRMWYWGVHTNNTADISYAWSVDDTTWHERPESVLEAGEPGTWDENDPWMSHIFYDTTMYHMYYITSEQVGHYEEIGHATSEDGINWERDTANPVLNLGPDGSFYDYRMFAGPLIFRNDTLHMFFSGYDIHDGTQHPMIGYAYSTDSPNWSVWTVGNNHMPVLEVGEPGSWDQKYADLPGVLYHNGIFHMWYDGRSIPIDGKIGYARQNVSCLPEGITFNSQAEIDSFQINCPNCNEIKGDVTIIGDDITNLSGLDNITSIGGSLLIHFNNALTSLIGLDNVAAIGGDLEIDDNASLTSLSRLDKVTSIGGDLRIRWHNILTNISGLDNINAGSISNLYISENDSLTTCEVQCICDYLSAPGGTIEIYDNAPGCNSVAEVEEACESASVNEQAIDACLSLYPNPTYYDLNISCEGYKIEEIAIYTLTGQQVMHERPVNGMIDISGLQPGMYIVEVLIENTRVRQKLLVQR